MTGVEHLWMLFLILSPDLCKATELFGETVTGLDEPG